ncbi:hypothetical protein HC891_02615 [Candidatus Gracilibacteria bacterium]|nr:hypothetical protein [Candidatus Gracilibacteria bacterium]
MIQKPVDRILRCAFNKWRVGRSGKNHRRIIRQQQLGLQGLLVEKDEVPRAVVGITRAAKRDTALLRRGDDRRTQIRCASDVAEFA